MTEKGRVIEATPILAFTSGWFYYRLAVLAQRKGWLQPMSVREVFHR